MSKDATAYNICLPQPWWIDSQGRERLFPSFWQAFLIDLGTRAVLSRESSGTNRQTEDRKHKAEDAGCCVRRHTPSGI